METTETFNRIGLFLVDLVDAFSEAEEAMRRNGMVDWTPDFEREVVGDPTTAYEAISLISEAAIQKGIPVHYGDMIQDYGREEGTKGCYHTRDRFIAIDHKASPAQAAFLLAHEFIHTVDWRLPLPHGTFRCLLGMCTCNDRKELMTYAAQALLMEDLGVPGRSVVVSAAAGHMVRIYRLNPADCIDMEVAQVSEKLYMLACNELGTKGPDELQRQVVADTRLIDIMEGSFVLSYR
jgi:hypothetical protein